MNRIAQIVIFVSLFGISACKHTVMLNYNLDIQGHRGCRGLMPENTIAGFISAVDMGVTTLEMDVVVSKDLQIIVSHEPFFNHEITTLPDGKYLDAKTEKNYNIYSMTTPEIQNIDVGLKSHPRFPLQNKIKTTKPTLHEVLDAVESHILQNKLKPINYNIEIKYDERGAQLYFPPCDLFADLLIREITGYGIKDKCIIQSFNPNCLNIVHKKDPAIQIALLVENKKTFLVNLSNLNFKPQIYSPNFKLVNKKLLEYCKLNQIKVIPWTVNEKSSVIKLLKSGVDGIISDYPDMVINEYEKLKITSFNTNANIRK